MRNDHEVTVIDRDESRLDQAREESGATVVLGDATEPSLLERSGIRAADVVVAVTGHDEDNLVVASLAKFEFEVPHVVGRVKNALNAWLYEPDMGVDVLVSAPHTIAQLIEEQVDGRRRRPAARARPRPGGADRGHAPCALAGRRPGGGRDRVAAGLRRGGGDPRHARARRRRATSCSRPATACCASPTWRRWSRCTGCSERRPRTVNRNGRPFRGGRSPRVRDASVALSVLRSLARRRASGIGVTTDATRGFPAAARVSGPVVAGAAVWNVWRMGDSLTPLDATFLEVEQADRTAHMHIGAVMIFGPPVPRLDDVCAQLDERLDALPRYRQRLSSPELGVWRWPHWEDDPEFDVRAHVRRAALPAPGGEAELLEWAGDFYSHRLDRRRPLWRMVLLEGLADEAGRWRRRRIIASSTASAPSTR